jgi:mono/diheme cytochrome c family protein
MMSLPACWFPVSIAGLSGSWCKHVIAGKNNMPPFAATLAFAQIRDVAAFAATELGK